jgi:hypothetical protein
MRTNLSFVSLRTCPPPGGARTREEERSYRNIDEQQASVSAHGVSNGIDIVITMNTHSTQRNGHPFLGIVVVQLRVCVCFTHSDTLESLSGSHDASRSMVVYEDRVDMA